MNIYIIPIMMAVWIGAMVWLFVPFLYFLIGLMGFMLGVGPVIMIIKLMAPRMYYYRARIYEDRSDGVYVEKDIRGRKVKGKDGHTYLETPSGEKFRFSSLEYFVSGTGGQLFGDFFRTEGTGKDSQLFPVKLNMEEKHIYDVRKNTIPVDQRAWFSDNRVLGYIKEATKVPLDTKMQVLQTMSFIGAVLMVAVIMLFYPTYLEEMGAYLQKDASQKAAAYQQLLDTINENQPIICNYEVSQPVVQQPQTSQTSPPG